MALLTALPRAHWTLRSPNGRSLLHYACYGSNADAARALLVHDLPVNERFGEDSMSAADIAAARAPSVLEVLCIAGADLRRIHKFADGPLEEALGARRSDSVRVLVANGVRLSSSRKHIASRISPELWAFERGVLRCRAAVVALLRVKRVSGKMVRWDKFLLAELAWCVWATRRQREWQTGHLWAM